MTIKTTTHGETGLPRYFQAVFDQAGRMEHGRLDMVLPDGRIFRTEGPKPGPVAELHIHNTDIFARLIREGDLGFCEAYLDGWWTTPDLQAFMDLVHADNEEVYDGFLGIKLVRAYERLRFWLQSNSRRQAKKNISYHYDLGNEFYGLWLDDTMTYSSAKFETGQESLEAAQIAKYASMVDQMGATARGPCARDRLRLGRVSPNMPPGSAGLRVTGLTISKEQHDYAVARIAKAGLADRVEIKLQDYRDERGIYDGIASIEMFEAVGEKYWPVYFDTLRERLKPGRQATLQIITVQDKRWEIYKRGVDFIQKYIFPGGMLPAPKVLHQQVSRAGLELAGSIRVRRELLPDAATLARCLR